MGKFSDTVHKFTIDAKKNSDVIFRTAVDDLYEDVIKPKIHGGNLPHDTGNLGRSVAVSKTAMPRVDSEEKEYAGGEGAGVIASAEAGDTLYIGVQAVYGPRRNYGFIGTDSLGRTYNETGDHFIEKSAAKWKQFVKAAESRFGDS